jgi:hypothetical protein
MTTQHVDVPAPRRPAEQETPFLGPGGWTPAHSEAALFLGECLAVGAVLGVVTEMGRLLWEQRHG